MGGYINQWIYLLNDRWMDGLTDGSMDRWMYGWIDQMIYELMDLWIDGFMD